MNLPPLANTTPYEHINSYIRGVVGMFEAAFPARVRAYYLVGSYATGEAIEASDVDLRIVFKGSFEPGEQARVEHLRQDCQAISTRQLDLPVRCEADLVGGHDDPLAIKMGGIFLYGEDIRDHLPLPSLPTYIQQVTGAAYRNIVVRYRGRTSVVAPLDFPDPDGAWRGYDVAGSTQNFVVTIGWAASSILAMQAQRYVARKSDWLRLYREQIADEWVPFLAAVYETCRNRWLYRIPDDTAGRAVFADLCEQALTFENHYLDIYRAYALVALKGTDPDTIRWALEGFGRIIYRDDAVRHAVARYADVDDLTLRATACHTLHAMRMIRG